MDIVRESKENMVEMVIVIEIDDFLTAAANMF